MTHGSLFSGIGGFDLAAEWMGWENRFHCEWNEFGQKVLKHYWPKAKSYGDIKEADFTEWRGLIDVVSGGFPCQPYSLAGKRKGKEDDRHLWPEMLRAIREIQPRWVVGENVFGLVNWSGGLVFHEVQADLEAAGYEVWPYVLPACAKNAPHRRDRVWFVAHSGSDGHSQEAGFGKNSAAPRTHKSKEKKRERVWDDAYGNDEKKSFANSTGIGQPESGELLKQFSSEAFGNRKASWSFNDGRWPTQSPICSGNDGVSPELDGITVSKHIEESLMAYGNAVVPQVVYEIFKAIKGYELSKTTHLPPPIS